MVAVLIVCSGNICRSPSAEAVLRHHLAAAGLEHRVTVDSAGTHGYHRGEPPSPLAIECGKARGYDLRPLRARQIRREDFDHFDLILAMDRGHLEELAGMRPEPGNATIRLFLEFATGAARGGAGGEVPDPYYGGQPDYEHSLDLIESAVPGLIETLRRQYL